MVNFTTTYASAAALPQTGLPAPIENAQKDVPESEEGCRCRVGLLHD